MESGMQARLLKILFCNVYLMDSGMQAKLLTIYISKETRDSPNTVATQNSFQYKTCYKNFYLQQYVSKANS